MRKLMLTAAASFIVGGIATGAALSYAQPTQPGAQPMQEVQDHHGMMEQHPGMMGHHPGMMGWMHRMHDGMHHERPFNPRDFALIYRQPDRNLAPADVQKIAEAFLLWNGNHAWKVSNVAATPEGPIGFSLTTASGAEVAKFTMDPHTGQIHRVG